MKDENLEEISKRFNNGTETIEDILNYCRNFLFTFENGVKMSLVEKKYLDKLIDEYKKISVELEKKDKMIDLMALAILNYDDQLVISRYKDIDEVKETFKDLAKEKRE